MTVSRRQFLRAGSLCAVFAGLSLSPYSKVFGQEAGRDAGYFEVPHGASTDPVFYYTRETFTHYVGGVFTIHSDTGKHIQATLVEVSDCRTAAQKTSGGMGECFALHFEHRSREAMPQGTRVIEHGALGKFRLFIVPGPTGASYVAVINHISPRSAYLVERSR